VEDSSPTVPWGHPSSIDPPLVFHRKSKW
jgi:hypothetical protein